MNIRMLFGLSTAMLALSAASVSADASELTASMNYETNKVELNYISTLEYPSYISVVMTKDGVTVPQISDYLRIAEGLCAENSSVMLTVDIGSDIDDGIYKFFANAGGYDAENAKAQAQTMILGAQSISEALKTVNRSPQTGIADLIYARLAQALQITDSGSNSWRDVYIYGEKKLNGEFTNLQQIKNAWDFSNVIKGLKEKQPSEIPAFLEETVSITGFDLTNEDYVSEKEETCRILQNMSGSSGKIINHNDLTNAFLESVALAKINKSSIEKKNDYIIKYQDILGISSLMSEYEKFDSIKAVRQMDGISFNSASEVFNKLKDIIQKLKPGSSSNTTPGVGGGGGSNSSSSGRPSMSAGTSAGANSNTVNTTEMFTDISSEHWAYPSVKALNDMSIINGYDDGSFKPDKYVTREEFAKLIALAFDISEEDGECGFTDIPEDDWCRKYVAAVTKRNIVNGIGENIFGRGQNIKRQDAAVMLDRALISLKTSDSDNKPEVTFSDNEEIADYAIESIGRLAEVGIINGIDGNFAPSEPVSRAQAAKMIYECMKYHGNGGFGK